MGKSLKVFLLGVFAFCFAAGASLAQEMEDTATEAEMYFASGTVVEASASKIVISEYDFDAGQETNVSYEVNAQTQVEGAAGMTDIKRDDDVEIEYQALGDKKIATRIEKYSTEDMDYYEEGTGAEATSPISMTKTEEQLNDATAEELKKEGASIETDF